MAAKRITKHGMTIRQPATRWQDALPCGNGSIGALVYGNIRNETVVLNHEALFLRREKPSIPDVSEFLPELRSLIEQGQYQRAEGFLDEKIREKGCTLRKPDPYHPACDLTINTDTRGAFTNYRRSLDFETGVASVTWKEGNTSFRRDLFVSRADDAVVMRIRGSRPGSVNCVFGLVPHGSVHSQGHEGRIESDEAPISFAMSRSKDWLTIIAQYEPEGGLLPGEFGGLAGVKAKGGEIHPPLGSGPQGIRITGAHEAVIVVKLFANRKSSTALRRLRREINELGFQYDALLKRHVALHREMFLRTRLDIDPGGAGDQTNEELLMAAYDGAPPAALTQKMFKYGRYLLICSSRPGGLPANLQGVWNGDYNPPWQSDYHNDENIQMNYWQALPGNLPEAAQPYFTYYESCLKDYRANAGALFGTRGIFVPISQATHGVAQPGPWHNWTAGAGWLAQLFYDYWLFTGDREFLKKHAVPYLKETALFYEDFLIEGEDGTLMFSPSLSPENVPSIPNGSLATINATMDVAVAREVLNNLCAACELLGIEKAGVKRWKKLLEKLPDYQVNEDGAIKEWIHPGFPDNYHHRHLAHIYPLFPGLEITEEHNPRLFRAVRVAVEKRLVIGLTSQSGWSLAHMANGYARLGDGDRALECLELLSRSCLGPNLFTYHNDWRQQGITLDGGNGYAPFQIDANFGWTAAVLEMLVYSVPGLLKLLPALPKKWPTGKAEGILCRGGIETSVEWDMHKRAVTARLRSKTKQEITLKLPGKIRDLSASIPKSGIAPSPYGEEYRLVTLPARKAVTLSVQLQKFPAL